MQLAKEGFLDKYNVQLLGANPETIDKAEDRQLFKDTMIEIGQPVIPSLVVTDVESAVKFADEIGYPVIIRPAFTLGGTGGGIVDNEEELREITSNGLELSPITQVLVENVSQVGRKSSLRLCVTATEMLLLSAQWKTSIL